QVVAVFIGLEAESLLADHGVTLDETVRAELDIAAEHYVVPHLGAFADNGTGTDDRERTYRSGGRDPRSGVHDRGGRNPWLRPRREELGHGHCESGARARHRDDAA